MIYVIFIFLIPTVFCPHKKRKIMEIIYVLLSVSLSISLLFLGIFIYNLRKGQFDDDYTPSVRILFDDKKK